MKALLCPLARAWHLQPLPAFEESGGLRGLIVFTSCNSFLRMYFERSSGSKVKHIALTELWMISLDEGHQKDNRRGRDTTLNGKTLNPKLEVFQHPRSNFKEQHHKHKFHNYVHIIMSLGTGQLNDSINVCMDADFSLCLSEFVVEEKRDGRGGRTRGGRSFLFKYV